jgi:spore maturation protein CgeB
MKNLIGKNIFYYFPSNGSVMDQWQNQHFIEELKLRGINFDVFNPRIQTIDSDSIEDLIYERIKANRENISMFLASAFDGYLSESFLISIKNLGIPTVLMSFDNLSIPYKQKEISQYFDLIWLTSWDTKYLFDKWGAKSIFLPYASNPNHFKPQWNEDMACIGFIGTLYGNRGKRIKDLYENGIPVQVYGKRDSSSPDNHSMISILRKMTDRICTVKELMKFPIGRKCIHGAVKKRIWNKKYNVQNSSFLDEIHQGSVSFEYLNYLYSNLGLSLGVTELWDTYTLSEPIHKIHLRTFEIPMCGGLQIAPYSKELSGYFEENKEIIFFENEMDLVEKSKFYLSDRNSQLRKEMKIKARIRAENDHSWSSRFKKLHDEIF